MLRVLILFTLVLGLGGTATAQDRASLLPDIPKATGKPHAEGNAWWRKNHMVLLKHDRDLTMYDGDREIAASLDGCFDCHSATNIGGTVLTYRDEGHFCRVCHDYAAVKVDCFMCHRSTPDGIDEGDLHAATVPAAKPEEREIAAYLDAVAGQETLK